MPIFGNIILQNNVSISSDTSRDVKQVKTFDELRQLAIAVNDIKVAKETRIENKINSKKTSRYLEDLTNKGD
jgi:hypothetical protein